MAEVDFHRKFWSQRVAAAFMAILAAMFLLGCSPLPRQMPAPPGQALHAEVSGMTGVRYFTKTQAGIDAVVREIERQRAAVPFELKSSTIDYLSISGGGDNGAFAAGLLAGWTQYGGRPTFNLVTGVSTGALIAPFAFLGPEYDETLREVYTTITPEKVYTESGVIRALTGDSYADTAPLYQLISEYVTSEVLKKIAHEYTQNHRWLIVATTDLDDGMPVAWNMGKIATYGTPQALKLFRRVLLASAAIPAAFPPVLFDVTLDGQSYQEMHVDGGASSQAFLYTPTLQRQLQQDPRYVKMKRRVFIIRNSRLEPERVLTERRATSIAARSIDLLIYNQGLGDLYRMYLIALADDLAYNLAYIQRDFDFPHEYEFETNYVRALYQYGFDQAARGYPWRSAPPGIEEPVISGR